MGVLHVLFLLFYFQSTNVSIDQTTNHDSIIILCFVFLSLTGTSKLCLSSRGHSVVLEADGTEVDEDAFLQELQSQTFIILMEGECWEEGKLGVFFKKLKA